MAKVQENGKGVRTMQTEALTGKEIQANMSLNRDMQLSKICVSISGHKHLLSTQCTLATG